MPKSNFLVKLHQRVPTGHGQPGKPGKEFLFWKNHGKSHGKGHKNYFSSHFQFCHHFDVCPHSV